MAQLTSILSKHPGHAAPSAPAALAEVRPRPRPLPTSLAGWGNNLRADCLLAEPELPGEAVASLDRAGTVARGLGRSYGDAAQNSGNSKDDRQG